MQTIPLDAVRLRHGTHGSTFAGTGCIVEVANRIAAGEVADPGSLPPTTPVAFSDDHPSISPVVRAFAIGLNDSWGDEERQRLRPFARHLLFTASGPVEDEVRAWLAADWLVRTLCPAFLELAGLAEHAGALQDLEPLVSLRSAVGAQPAMFHARRAGAVAVSYAAREGATAAPGALRVAARSAGTEAAAVAAGLGRGPGAGPAAAARSTAWDVAGAAWRADPSEVRATVERLQASALELLGAMLHPGAIRRQEPPQQP